VENNKWGSILKSNYNGTYYTLSLKYVNRDIKGFVDFEKMRGIVGIAMANVFSNVNEVNMCGYKKIKSKITFDDGKLSKNFVFFSFCFFCFRLFSFFNRCDFLQY